MTLVGLTMILSPRGCLQPCMNAYSAIKNLAPYLLRWILRSGLCQDAGAPFFDAHPLDLQALTERTVIYEGPAQEAVRLFPENVNVAAAISLSGLGADRTLTQVVADPTLDRNVHEVSAHGDFGEMRITLRNVPSPSNAKTSYLACLSPLATLRRLAEPIQIG